VSDVVRERDELREALHDERINSARLREERDSARKWMDDWASLAKALIPLIPDSVAGRSAT
jgi:hypothetical protein